MLENNYARVAVKSARKTNAQKAIDRICYVGSVFMPATAVPQIHQLYTTHDADSLSLLMWILYLVGVIPFLLFGIIHNEKQLVVLNVLWLAAIVAMIFGIVIYS